MFKIITDGLSYSEGIPLSSAVSVLENFGKIYNAGIDEARKNLGVSPADKPTLKVESVKDGSGEFLLFIAAATTAIPHTPEFYLSVWESVKKAYSLIETLKEFIEKYHRPMNIIVTNSPGTLIATSGRDSIQVSQDVLNVAKAVQKPLENIAKMVKADRNSYAKTYYTEKYNDQRIITQENADNFIGTEVQITDQEETEVEVNIFKLNKKTLVGRLEFHDGVVTREAPFIASKESAVMAAIALAAERCTATALLEYEVNIFNEKRIIRFHITNIEIPK